MKNKIILGILSFLMIFSSLSAQNEGKNLKKYWTYRDILNQRHIVKDLNNGKGTNIPFKLTHYDSPGNNPGFWTADFGDGNYWYTYIGVLATEYKLLADHGQPTTETVKDLYLSLIAIDRLIQNGNKLFNCFSPSSGPDYKDGFLVRDDAAPMFPNNYPSYAANTSPHSISNLGGGSVGGAEGTWAGPVGSASGTIDDSYTPDGDALAQQTSFISEDILGNILTGLCLIKKCVPNTVTYTNPNTGQTVNIVAKAQSLADRIFSNLDLVTALPLVPNRPFKTFPGSESMISKYYSLAFAYQYITGATDRVAQVSSATPVGTVVLGTYFIINAAVCDWSFGGVEAFHSALGSVILGMILQNPPIYARLCKLMELYDSTQAQYNYFYRAQALRDWAISDKETGWLPDSYDETGIAANEGLLIWPILHGYLYSKNTGNTNSIQNLMSRELDSAPCDGELSVLASPMDNQWNSTNHWTDAEYDRKHTDLYNRSLVKKVENTGLDYMLAYNLYHLYYPNSAPYYNTNNTTGTTACITTVPRDIPNTGGGEPSFVTTEVIEGDILIANQNTVLLSNFSSTGTCTDFGMNKTYYHPGPSASNTANGRLTLAASTSIVLEPGFSVPNGASFEAIVAPFYCSPSATAVSLPYSSYGNAASNATSNGCHENNEMYSWGGYYFIVQKSIGRILKLNNIGFGNNMCALSFDPTRNLPGYQYLKGVQDFNTAIQDIEYTGSELLIGFADGKMLKIAGTGGGGANMFAINETSYGFSGVSGYNYYIGHTKFNSPVMDIVYFNGKTLVALQDGKILKVNGTGGGGANMFAVNETQYSFSSVPGYNYYEGYAIYANLARKFFVMNGTLFLTFYNGNILKINGAGGMAANIFATDENPYGDITSMSGWNYTPGWARFSSYVTTMAYVNNKLIIGFNNGKILKINDLGGWGANMFAVNETASGFTNFPGYSYYAGHSEECYSALVTILPIGNSTLFSFQNGKVIKIEGTGGLGNNMFNATETPTYFTTTNPNNHIYLQGSDYWGTKVSDMKYGAGGDLFICLANNKIARIKGAGGFGASMFAAVQGSEEVTPMMGYDYVIGSQYIPCGSSNRLMNPASDTEETTQTLEEQAKTFTIYPNPFQDKLNINLSGQEGEEVTFELFDVNGKLVLNKSTKMDNETLNWEMSIEDMAAGMYLYKVKIGDHFYSGKVIKE